MTFRSGRFQSSLTLALWLLATPVIAQTQGNTHVSTGASLPTVCRVGDIYYLTTSFVGLYRCYAANTWALVANRLPTITVGNDGTTTAPRGVVVAPTFTGGTIADWAGQQFSSPVLTGTTMTLGRHLYFAAPPQTGTAMTYWRAMTFAKQTTPLTSNSLIIEADTPNAGYFYLWANGALQSQIVNSSTTLLPGDNFGHDFVYAYTGADPAAGVVSLMATTAFTPTTDTTTYAHAIHGDLEANGTHTLESFGAVAGYVSVNDSVNAKAGASVFGGDFEAAWYSSATAGATSPVVGGQFGGGVGSGTVTNFYNLYAYPLWDNTGVVLNHVGLQIDAVADGTTSNWAVRYTNAGAAQGGIKGSGALVDAPEADTVGVTATVTPGTSSARLSCTNGGGCAITMGETGITDGQLVRIVNVSANVCTFTDTAGVTELAGNFAMGQWDTLVLQYITDRWVEVSRSNN